MAVYIKLLLFTGCAKLNPLTPHEKGMTRVALCKHYAPGIYKPLLLRTQWPADRKCAIMSHAAQ